MFPRLNETTFQLRQFFSSPWNWKIENSLLTYEFYDFSFVAAIQAGKACISANNLSKHCLRDFNTKRFHCRELIIKTNMSLVNYNFSTRFMMKIQRFSTIVAFKWNWRNAFCRFSPESPSESWNNKEILQEQRPASRQPLDGCRPAILMLLTNPKTLRNNLRAWSRYLCLSRFKTVLLMSCLTKRFWLNYHKISACQSNQLRK